MRLAIELIPSTCWYSNVRSNVRPSTWDRLQRSTFQAAGYVCEICGGVGAKHPVEAHEIWQYDDHRLIQRLERLIALCPRCHEVKHIGLAIETGNAQRTLAWLCSVNAISPPEGLAYIKRAFQIHQIRSRFPWQLDIEQLTRDYGVILNKHGMEDGLPHSR